MVVQRCSAAQNTGNVRHLPTKEHIFHFRPCLMLCTTRNLLCADLRRRRFQYVARHRPSPRSPTRLACSSHRALKWAAKFFPAEEHHQIRYPPVINIRIWMRQHPPPLIRIGGEIRGNVSCTFSASQLPARDTRESLRRCTHPYPRNILQGRVCAHILGRNERRGGSAQRRGGQLLQKFPLVGLTDPTG